MVDDELTKPTDSATSMQLMQDFLRTPEGYRAINEATDEHRKRRDDERADSRYRERKTRFDDDAKILIAKDPEFKKVYDDRESVPQGLFEGILTQQDPVKLFYSLYKEDAFKGMGSEDVVEQLINLGRYLEKTTSKPTKSEMLSSSTEPVAPRNTTYEPSSKPTSGSGFVTDEMMKALRNIK